LSHETEALRSTDPLERHDGFIELEEDGFQPAVLFAL
jgi:hypothetical protein